jgi:hypothetical protein
MLLQFRDRQPFATGAVSYNYRPVTEHETAPRLVVEIEIEGLRTDAIVDTGGIFLLCPPAVANRLGLDERAALGEEIVMVRGSRVTGKLHRVTLTLLAEEGQNLSVEVTALIPTERRDEAWVHDLPCFLGLQGCLERLRFAVDRTAEKFYFGPVG